MRTGTVGFKIRNIPIILSGPYNGYITFHGWTASTILRLSVFYQ